jgi:DnaJ-class molecular chaperone
MDRLKTRAWELCPDCRGSGAMQTTAWLNPVARVCVRGWMECERCRGTGLVLVSPAAPVSPDMETR